MLERKESLQESTMLTRRTFTLEAALLLLAGCVITITDACSSSNNPTTPTPAATDLNGVVAQNHGHVATVTAAQITATNAVSLNIQGTATHNHTLALSQADLQTLKNRQPVARDSSNDLAHMHTVTFTPV